MSKWLGCFIGVVGIAAVSVTGVVFMQGERLAFESVEEFKKHSASSNCVSGYFGGLDTNVSLQTNQEVSSASPASGAFFKTNGGTDPKSCLVVNWQKTTYGKGDDKKWTGKFTWLWTFVKGDEGLINFNVAESSSTSDGQMNLTGITFLVAKDTSAQPNKWVIKHYIKSQDNKTVDSSNGDSNFPKVKTDLSRDAGGDFWGFVENKDGFSKSCKEGVCPTEKTKKTKVEKKEFVWTKATTGGTMKPSDWGANTTWWTQLYGSTWDISTKLGTEQQGTWAKKE